MDEHGAYSCRFSKTAWHLAERNDFTEGLGIVDRINKLCENWGPRSLIAMREGLETAKAHSGLSYQPTIS